MSETNSNEPTTEPIDDSNDSYSDNEHIIETYSYTNEHPELPLNEEKFKITVQQYIQQSKINKFNYKHYNSCAIIHDYQEQFYSNLEHWWMYPIDFLEAIKRICEPIFKSPNPPAPDWKLIIKHWNETYEHYDDDEEESAWKKETRTPISRIIEKLISTKIISTKYEHSFNLSHLLTELCMERLSIPIMYYSTIKQFVIFELLHKNIDFKHDYSNCEWNIK